jgi:hypothetical protein
VTLPKPENRVTKPKTTNPTPNKGVLKGASSNTTIEIGSGSSMARSMRQFASTASAWRFAVVRARSASRWPRGTDGGALAERRRDADVPQGSEMSPERLDNIDRSPRLAVPLGD